MPFRILEQKMTVRGVEFWVEIKKINCFPVDDSQGNVKWKHVGCNMFKVVLRHDKAPEDGSDDHKIVWNDKTSPEGVFIYHYADKWEYPSQWVGQGRSRRRVEMRGEKIKKPGEQERFESMDNFQRFLEQKVGADKASHILGLFLGKMVEYECGPDALAA